MALKQNGPFRQRDGRNEAIWTMLSRLWQRGVRVSFVFVYAHAGCVGNLKVDNLAKLACHNEIYGPQWAPDLVREISSKIRAADDKAPKGTIRKLLKVESIASLHRVRIYSNWSWTLLLQLRVGACPPLNMHLNGIRFPCKVCNAQGAISKDKALDSLTHIFTCPGMEEFRRTQYGDKLKEAADLRARIGGFPPEDKMTREEFRERDRLQTKLDKVAFSPLLLWTNILMAISYAKKYYNVGKELDRLRCISSGTPLVGANMTVI